MFHNILILLTLVFSYSVFNVRLCLLVTANATTTISYVVWLSGYLFNRRFVSVPLSYYFNFYCQVVFLINFKNFCYLYFQNSMCNVHVFQCKTKKIKIKYFF